MIVSRIDERCINTIRCVSAALPEMAKSGHPGAPMGCAVIAHVLWTRIMNHTPENPEWPGRDRFVLSNGHACALQYTMLHLAGYDISCEDLKQFRQLHSKTPGHPECFQTPGVEVTTGPLGQGIAQAVGLAIGAEIMAAKYNRPDICLFNNLIYTLVGDGCLEEGVSSEACSLAGHLGLGRLIVFYDKNDISIDGHTDLAFSENVAMRFQAYGWNVLEVINACVDVEGLYQAIKKAQESKDKPTLIICHTIIGYGSKNQGTEKVHGSPIGNDEIILLRKRWNLPCETTDLFTIEQEVYDFYAKAAEKCSECYATWMDQFKNYSQHYPNDYRQLLSDLSGELPNINWETDLPQYSEACPAQSTRALSGQILNCLADKIQNIIGGSADLTASNCTALKGIHDFTKSSRTGRYIRYGVREHAMAAVSNGIYAFGGLRPFAATFLNFITYAWGAVRLSALSKFGVLYIATHDSIGLGEDGPTHQPIEVAALCRATPNLNYFRPADGREVIAGYQSWLRNSTRPTVLALTRGSVPQLKNSSVSGALRGGYILKNFSSNNELPRVILASCGSEVSICVEASLRLEKKCNVRVVSMPCWEIFLEQQLYYQEEVLLHKDAKRFWVEAASVPKYAQFFDQTWSMTSFGACAPEKELNKFFGFTCDNIEKLVLNEL